MKVAYLRKCHLQPNASKRNVLKRTGITVWCPEFRMQPALTTISFWLRNMRNPASRMRRKSHWPRMDVPGRMRTPWPLCELGTCDRQQGLQKHCKFFKTTKLSVHHCILLVNITTKTKSIAFFWTNLPRLTRETRLQRLNDYFHGRIVRHPSQKKTVFLCSSKTNPVCFPLFPSGKDSRLKMD